MKPHIAFKIIVDLRIINLYNNPLKDISSLENLVNTEILNISGTKIESIVALSKMKHLKKLYAGESSLKNVKGVEGCSALELLYIGDCEVTAINELSNLSNLKVLSVYDLNIDYSPLLTLRQIDEMSITDSDLSIILNDKHRETLLKLCELNPNMTLHSHYYAQTNDDYTDDYAGYTTSKVFGDYKQLVSGEAYERALKVQEIKNKIIRDDMSEYEKVKTVHDYLVENIKYDDDYYYKGIENYINYSGPHVLTEGYAVCAGYADAAKLLLEMSDVNVIQVTGVVDGPKGREDHAWNIVEIEGKYYHMDITWDDHDNGNISYNHFLLSEKEMIEKGNRVINIVNNPKYFIPESLESYGH